MATGTCLAGLDVHSNGQARATAVQTLKPARLHHVRSSGCWQQLLPQILADAQHAHADSRGCDPFAARDLFG